MVWSSSVNVTGASGELTPDAGRYYSSENAYTPIGSMKVDIGHPVTSRTLWAVGGKRAFDLGAATLLVLVCSPMLIAFALAIKLTSRGPLFFKHTRIGTGGREFEPFKFRTMYHGRKHDAVELVPLDHPEITRVGRLLRRTKLDELPQVFNVVKGEMSLVGPRPDLPQHVEKYTPFKLQRLAVRPGLTGLAQVNGSAAISLDKGLTSKPCRVSATASVITYSLARSDFIAAWDSAPP